MPKAGVPVFTGEVPAGPLPPLGPLVRWVALEHGLTATETAQALAWLGPGTAEARP